MTGHFSNRLLASMVFFLLSSVPPADIADALEQACTVPDPYAMLISPESAVKGDTLRVLVASETPVEGASLEVTGPTGPVKATRMRSGGGPPAWWAAELEIEETGSYRAALVKSDTVLACRKFKATGKRKLRKQSSGAWDTTMKWTRGRENLFSSWVELLFLDSDEGASWNPLHEVMRDPVKNLLHNHLGIGEDDDKGVNALNMEPDCADNPFFLRAYFSWKLGLPYGNHSCTRGSATGPPRCNEWMTNDAPRAEGSEGQAFNHFLRDIMKSIHSGSARTALKDEATDLYPVPLTREDLRPGVVFADPYGHTLTIVRWVPQTEKKPGQLLAVDAQPDGTIGVKRFWRGNFLFTTKAVIGEPGFKTFRPIVKKKGRLELVGSKEIEASKDYGNYSLQQHNMDSNAFYDAMDRLINPKPLDPESAYKDLLKAVHEQLLVRVTSVANGDNYMKANKFNVISMPKGVKIFQTSGPWEDYSTPSRDMRILIAMDILLDFPDKIIRVPEAFSIPEGKPPAEVKKEVQKLHAEMTKQMTLSYTRSDGSEQVLTVAEILERIPAFEMAYNPNDCIEWRWGAPEGSDELSTCKRKAPADQLKKMEAYREWFHERRRPLVD
ncbi:MAG: hypothetical protein ABIJ56_01655 [Pseudomonadota bacterium]